MEGRFVQSFPRSPASVICSPIEIAPLSRKRTLSGEENTPQLAADPFPSRALIVAACRAFVASSTYQYDRSAPSRFASGDCFGRWAVERKGKGKGGRAAKGGRASDTIPQKPSVISLSLPLSVSRYPASRDVDLVNHAILCPLSSSPPSSLRQRWKDTGCLPRREKTSREKVGISGLSGKVSAASRRSRLPCPPFFKIDASTALSRRGWSGIASVASAFSAAEGRTRAKAATRG